MRNPRHSVRLIVRAVRETGMVWEGYGEGTLIYSRVLLCSLFFLVVTIFLLGDFNVLLLRLGLHLLPRLSLCFFLQLRAFFCRLQFGIRGDRASGRQEEPKAKTQRCGLSSGFYNYWQPAESPWTA